jgi:hypothetical protein
LPDRTGFFCAFFVAFFNAKEKFLHTDMDLCYWAFAYGTVHASFCAKAKIFSVSCANTGKLCEYLDMQRLFCALADCLRSRPGRILRLGCVLLCALALWGLVGCGAQRSSSLPSQAPPAAKKVVESAYSQLGVRYRSGGNSPGKGFDCSGLVQWAYKQQGISLPRITKEQARTGRLVAPQEGLQPADILVFKNKSGPHGLHTGLYTGDGRFIHSPSSGQRVRTESLTTAYWKNSLIGARRLIN